MDAPQDREDLEQEIIFQLWRSYDRYEGDSKFATWMYRAAINTAITFFKKEKLRPDNTPLIPEIDIEEEDLTEDTTRLAHFYKAVKKLSRVEKAVILLFIEGNSHQVIAENLGITPVNARVKLNRTKKKLKEIIKQQGYEF
ncbi:MAG: RNA polymerase sigma factor [Crocinitomicaceae bacterium]